MKKYQISVLTAALLLLFAAFPALAEEEIARVAPAAASEVFEGEDKGANVPEAAAAPTSSDIGKIAETPIGNVLTEESKLYTRGEKKGVFMITGYYGDGNTYSGKPTKSNHTIAADTSVLPLGTKIFIGNTVYTVEDIGSGVKGQMIDIYFDSREEALGVTWNGNLYAEVFLAVPKK